MKRAKEFVYRYVGAEHLDLTEVDLTGQRPLPKKGTVYSKEGGNWKVYHVFTQFWTDGQRPIVRVSLVKML